MDLSIYFQPVHLDNEEFRLGTLGSQVAFHSSDGFPELQGIQIAIIGVKEDRRALSNKGCAGAPDVVRGFLYRLFQGDVKVKIADLGNIEPGREVKDTYFALSDVISELILNRIVPVVIGGSQDLTYANYQAYEKLERTVNLAVVDDRFDLGDVDDELNADSFLSKIVLHQPNFLFNYSNIGYQTYFVDSKSLDLMNKLHFDVHRLGDVQVRMDNVEPVVRNADFLSLDVSAIRQSDAPGNVNASPHGLYGEQACQITRYAGLSDKLSSIGFYEVNPTIDKTGQTAHLVAQMIWYFIEGYTQRKREFPVTSKKGYVKYRVVLEEDKYEIMFYKSRKSDRWWMDVPYPPNQGIKYERHHLVPCAYDDYQIACKEELPDRWWKTYQKLL